MTEPKKEEGKTLSEQEMQIAVAGIQQFGDKLTLPAGMSIKQGIALLERRLKYDQEETAVQRTYPVFPWDGAVALDTVLREKYGWAQAIATPGFFGDSPPTLVTVETDYDKTQQVAWGRFAMPGVDGFIQTDAQKQSNGMWYFTIAGQVKRKHEPQVRKLLEEVNDEIKRRSIYRGKAIMPEPKFLRTSHISPEQVVYSDETMRAVVTNLYTPIQRVDDCKRNDIPIKRGILLGGTYGTGKTMAAAVASRLAVDNGITYIYVPRADELKDAIEFAKQYQSPASVVFCEDIDRVTNGERSVEMDDILNIIDGVDSKSSNIIVVLTTNDLESINPAMLRPGRLDAVIQVTPPDAKAVEKLIRLYAGDAVDPATDLSAVGTALAGNIPAIISEVVKRAKLSELAILPEGERVTKLSADALLDSARTMTTQMALLDKAINGVKPKAESLEVALGNVVLRALGNDPVTGEEAAERFGTTG